MGLRSRLTSYGRPAIEAALPLAIAVSTASSDIDAARAGGYNLAYFDWDPSPGIAIPFGLLVGAAVWGRRRRPVLFVVLALAAWVVLSAFVALMLAQYTLAERTASRPKIAVSTFVGAVVVAIPLWRVGGPDAAVPPAAAICLAPALLGLYVGTRRELIARVRERAERAEREQHRRVLQARSDERAQIARDMHDVVTHRVALMVLHATALEAAQGRDAVEIGARIGAIGREALGELRSLVEVLRTGDVALVPQPGLADLEDLVAASRRTGTPVEFEMVDASRGERVPVLVEHAVYRVVQEALSNAHKHAAGARTRVRVERVPGALRLSVTNGRGRSGAPGLPGGGHGLLGIAERIRLIGGELTARPVPGGGFEIRAEVPLG
ncbi:sensor histidine kinase [Actinocorallia populi]|uniref:sensor histidine kinase n=1 Tax=Actinocorallia populi TaxID=2079200 RepID=UPI000D08A1D0|nr:histidine kinase [Actinocorallia populi]